MLPEKSYTIKAESVQWQIVDDEAVLIHTETSEYFSMNTTATVLWNSMVTASRNDQFLVQYLSSRYDAALPSLQSDVTVFLENLLQADLIICQDPGCGHPVDSTDSIIERALEIYEPPDVVKFGNLERVILSGE